MTFGHLALANIARDTLFKDLNFYFLAMAAFGPDLADKPLCLLFGWNSRGIGHTVLIFLCALAVGWLCYQRKAISLRVFRAGALLWLSHLAADFLDKEILFWPLLGPFPQKPPLDFWQHLDRWLHFYRNWHWSSLQFILECALILVALHLRAQSGSGWNPLRLLRQHNQNS